MNSHDTAIEAAEAAYWSTENDPEGARDMRAAISAYLKEMGSEAACWVRAGFIDDLHKEGTHSGIQTVLWLDEETAGKRHPKRIPLFLAPSEDIEKLKAERDEALERSRDYPAISAKLHDREKAREAEQRDCRNAIARAEAAEAERDAKAALLEEARRVLEPFAKAFDELREWSDLGEMITHDDLSAAKSFLARLESPDAAK